MVEIEYGLIMSAGLGTRMGPIGEVLPKVLWPIYETTLLSLQIKRLKELGCKKILVNSHFLHEQVVNFVKEKHDGEVEIFYESILYGSGGTINELIAQKRICPQGTLLYSAGDQFYFFDEKSFKIAIAQIKNYKTILFGLNVGKDSGYGELILNEQKILEHIKPTKNKMDDFVTFSGLGLINLSKVSGQKGYSEFFRTVAPLGGNNKIINPNHQEYWDFGTATKYFISMQNLTERLKNRTSDLKFIDFFLRNTQQNTYNFAEPLLFNTAGNLKFEIFFKGLSKGFSYNGLFHGING